MVSFYSHPATLTSCMKMVRLALIALGLIAWPFQPAPAAASSGGSSSLIALPAALIPIGHQYQGRFPVRWPQLTALGKERRGTRLSALRRSRSAMPETGANTNRIAAAIPLPAQALPHRAAAGRAPPSR